MIIVILLFLTSVCSFPLGLGENHTGHAENALDDQVSPMARPPGDDKDALVAEFKKKVHQLTSTMNDHADNLDRFISVLNSMSAKNDTSKNPVRMNGTRSSSSGPVSRVKRSPRGQTCTCMSNNHFESYCLQQLLQRLSKPKTLGRYDVSQRDQSSASEIEDPATDWEPDVEEVKTLSRAEPVDYYPVQDASEQVSQEEIDSQVLGLFGRKKKAVTQNSGFSDESLRIRSENDMLKSTLQSVADKMVEMQGEMASLKESQADCIQSKEIARKMEPPPVSFRISNVPTGSRGPWAGQLADSMAGQPAGRLSVTAPSYKIKDWTAMVLDDMGVAQQMAALGAVPGNAQRYGGQALRNPSGWSRATAMGPRTLTTVTEETPPKADRMKDVRKGIKETTRLGPVLRA
ncbi:hypothetical protein HDE_00355 [Halotydeus destructor]|nr:hypothetical protein HDE_00355 [Halotydeus destructor]